MRLSKQETQSVAPTPKFKRGGGAFPSASAHVFMAYQSIAQEKEDCGASKERYERLDAVCYELWEALRKMGVFKC